MRNNSSFKDIIVVREVINGEDKRCSSKWFTNSEMKLRPETVQIYTASGLGHYIFK